MYCYGPYAGGRHRSLCLAIVTCSTPRWAHLRTIHLTIHQPIHTRKILSKSPALSSPELVIDTDRLLLIMLLRLSPVTLNEKTQRVKLCERKHTPCVETKGFSFSFSIDHRLRGPCYLHSVTLAFNVCPALFTSRSVVDPDAGPVFNVWSLCAFSSWAR